MAYRVFVVPNGGCPASEEEMNAFLRSNRVLHVERRWVDDGPASRWSFCVEFADPAVAAAAQDQRARRERERIDHRAQLAPAELPIFERLRLLRTELATVDRVPPYMVFNDKQLVQMIQDKAGTLSDLGKLPGVGDSRVEKYGQRFLDLLSELRNGQEGAADKPPADGTKP